MPFWREKQSLMALANSKDTVLIGLGGGCKDIEVHVFETSPVGPMVVAHLLVDVRDAMGANTVNTMAELLAPRVADLAGGQSRLRILSNLADRRLVRAQVAVSFETLSTEAAGRCRGCARHRRGLRAGADRSVPRGDAQQRDHERD